MDKQTILTLAALLLTSSAWGQSKQEGEVELSGGYGNTAPYASRLQLNLGEGKVVFKPFVGIKGLARHSSEQNLDEHYIFTGKMPLSETVGSQYYSHQTTEAKGMMADYGFQFAYRPTTQQTLTVSLRGESLHKDERGTLAERLLAPDGAPLAKTRWRLDNPLLRSNHLEVGADYTCRFKRDDVTLSYKYQRDRDEAERQLEALQLEGFSDFQATLTTADATVHHHDLRLIYNTQALLGHLRLVARYENRLAESDDQQWIDDCLALGQPFPPSLPDGSSLVSLRRPSRPAEATGPHGRPRFAYTDMAGKKLRDFLPTGRIGWQVSRTSQLALGYNRRLVRPSLTLLNPVVLRTPFAVRQGNKDLEGLHANVFALSFYPRRSDLLLGYESLLHDVQRWFQRHLDGARQPSHLSMGQRGQAARMEHSARLHAPCLHDNEGPWPGRHTLGQAHCRRRQHGQGALGRFLPTWRGADALCDLPSECLCRV